MLDKTPENRILDRKSRLGPTSPLHFAVLLCSVTMEIIGLQLQC